MVDLFHWRVIFVAILAFCTVNSFAAPEGSDPLETIQIRGIRGSVVQSINTKKQSDSIVDAITAEEIGKFPDKNVAESLQRITGVSLTRLQGEGERIGVRGTAPSQNRTYINGQTIASADWWISAQPNRGFNYTMLPAEIVSSLEVHKSPQADHDEGSLGGSVSINTRTPLDTPDQMFVGTAQLQYNDVSEETDPQLSALYNWINHDNTFGALVSVTRHERSLRRDGLESWGWTSRNFNEDAAGHLVESKEADADHTNIWSPGGGGSAVFQQQRVLSSAMLSLQYQPNVDWNIELNSLYSTLNADNTNQNMLWQPSAFYSNGGTITDYQINDNTLSYAAYSQVDQGSNSSNSANNSNNNSSMEAIWRASRIETGIIQLLLEHDYDYWQTSYQLGFTRATGGTNQDYTSQWSANTEYAVDLTHRKDIQVRYETDPLQANAWQISDVRWDKQNSTDQELFAQADFEVRLDRPYIQSIQFGGKYKRHQRDFLRIRSRNGVALAADLDWTLADYSAPFPSHYLTDVGSDQTVKAFTFADVTALDKAFKTLDFSHSEEQPSSFDIVESSYAFYGKMNMVGQSYRANVGVRVVHTQQDAAAFRQIGADETALSDHLWFSNEKNYTDILPSINIAMDWSKEVVFRLSASKVMSRPEYHHLMPSTNYNVTQAQGAGGNPQLDPFRATKFDVSLEWYFDEASLFSIALFQQEVKSFIDINRSIEEYEDIDMVISRPVNGSGGSIYGAELSWQQELLYGFGVMANYTYVQGERKDLATGLDVEIPGNSDHTMNLTTYFENDWLSTRLSYNFRTEFATGVGEAITDDFGQWDINVAFILSETTSLVVEGINLTDEILYTYERNEYAPVGIYRNGRRFYAGVRFSF
ncbi:MAG: iron complex outermembrane receptor protein [Phenylobacterium sp.]|jgi:iron complex outermembrane receptor protein